MSPDAFGSLNLTQTDENAILPQNSELAGHISEGIAFDDNHFGVFAEVEEGDVINRFLFGVDLTSFINGNLDILSSGFGGNICSLSPSSSS